MFTKLAAAATVLALAAASGGALAQTPTHPPDIAPPDKYGSPIGPGQPPEQQAQPAPDQDNGSLSNHRSGSGGVVQPPSTDDRGVITPPNAGPHAMPVIPPPNAPNGNPNVAPK